MHIWDDSPVPIMCATNLSHPINEELWFMPRTLDSMSDFACYLHTSVSAPWRGGNVRIIQCVTQRQRHVCWGRWFCGGVSSIRPYSARISTWAFGLVPSDTKTRRTRFNAPLRSHIAATWPKCMDHAAYSSNKYIIHTSIYATTSSQIVSIEWSAHLWAASTHCMPHLFRGSFINIRLPRHMAIYEHGTWGEAIRQLDTSAITNNQ